MKTLITAIALTAALSTPVFAESDHDHQQGNDMKGAGMEGGMMMGMMDQEHMKKMHQHMQDMQKLMADIKQESDPQKRQQLMHKHMQTMQHGMHMMMGKMKGGHEMKDQMDMPSMQMDERMGMMEKRMNMMQMMMDQMMQHQAEEKKQQHNKH
jgi:periplasmic protein CpxP/Spy